MVRYKLSFKKLLIVYIYHNLSCSTKINKAFIYVVLLQLRGLRHMLKRLQAKSQSLQDDIVSSLRS